MIAEIMVRPLLPFSNEKHIWSSYYYGRYTVDLLKYLNPRNKWYVIMKFEKSEMVLPQCKYIIMDIHFYALT